MFWIASRIGAVAAAAAIAAAVALWSPSSTGNELQFASVLANISEADSVQIEITAEGQPAQLWAKQPGRLRVNHPDGTYSIARGDRIWRVDEKANQAASGPSPYFREDQPGLDLLALLDLPADSDRQTILTALPAEQVEQNGRQIDVYRMELAAGPAPLRVEALVDTQTRMLRSISSSLVRVDRVEPIRRIEIVAVDKPVDESLFIIGDTLTEDGRVGKVTDSQGIVSVKPVMRKRWTPVVTHTLIKPGDWVRTDARGANAVALRLVKATDVTLGPGSLVEVIRPNQIRLVHGVLKVVAEEGAPLELLGPDQQKIEVSQSAIYRLAEEKLVLVEQPPKWLQGFEGATADESLGSLIANVEGRNVPLTVGYHKVTVEIRDQIARTVIEESFVNHIDHGPPLEGIFYFPLPQDASISGFGMWIDGELIEADVVEKQRAREIYEIILRERRDPGLLEWTGGNIFKARVFPIPPGGEKRIKISYTQVLPLRGNSYRYSYALRSEMLRQHPLRELAIDLKLYSVMPLAKVSSPTHTTRIDNTEHSAHVEFSAQEYTPTRDFEVEVELAGSQSNVVMIPHRRGEDGYFMLMLTPPDGEGQWQREVPSEDKPLRMLILADTSGSIDADSRQTQAELIASLLCSLTPDDEFNLACCDVDCTWAFESPVAATEENVQKARDMLDARVSLGWTDLDEAFASAVKQAGGEGSGVGGEASDAGGQGSEVDSHVIYVGDGIVTTGDADPTDFARRLKLLCDDKAVSLHAISVSSSFEPMVMRAIASLGGGSVRQVSGQQTPQVVALELLDEVSRPTLRDLKVEFRGIRTARVYPDQLPNLPAGTQQILLGRYLPLVDDSDQQGEVVVSGMQGGEPLEFSTAVSLADAEEGNSFIPRLWARMHLDALLAQGGSSMIRDEIIALSEEYHIMTPYTSLLVLETDEDRERFKVKRQFQMRDAERFFAEGMATVNYELLQQQMIRAGDWRRSLRRDVLAELLTLGRDIGGFETAVQRTGGSYHYLEKDDYMLMLGGMGGPTAEGELYFNFSQSEAIRDDGMVYTGAEELKAKTEPSGWFREGADEMHGEYPEAAEPYPTESPEMPQDRLLEFGSRLDSPEESLRARGSRATSTTGRSRGISADATSMSLVADMPVVGRIFSSAYPGEPVIHARKLQAGNQLFERYPSGAYSSWLNTFFPSLPAAPQEERPFEPEKPWPEEARDLADRLLRTEQLAALEGGLSILRHAEGFEPRLDRLTSQWETLELVSPRAWLIRSGGYGSATTVNWCDAQQRGVLSRAFQLGRLRKSTPLDLSKPPLGLPSHTRTSLARTYHSYNVELKPQTDDQVLLVLSPPNNPDYQLHYLIDTARDVLLSTETHSEGKVTSTTRYDQFVEIAGSWYAGRSQTFDKEERLTSVTTEEFVLLTAEDFDARLQGQLAGRDRVQFLHEPLVTLADAKRALAEGKAGFGEQMTLLLHFCDSQQWDRVLEHLEQAEELAADKPGLRWVRSAILNNARRREELKQRYLAEADRLAGAAAVEQGEPPEDPYRRGDPDDSASPADQLYLANYLYGQCNGILEANEMLTLLDVLKPVYQRQPEHIEAMKQWGNNQISRLRSAGRGDEALALRRQMAEDYPHDCNMQQQYAQELRSDRQFEAAYAWLDRVITEEARWLSHEEDSLRRTYTDLLYNQGRWPELAEYASAWVKRDLEGSSAFERYLGVLIRIGEIDKANALISQWLDEGRQAEDLSNQAAGRLNAAVRQALGQGWQNYTNRIEEQWFEPLAEAVRFFARHKTQSRIAEQIMSHGHFRDSDHCRGLRREYLGVLQAEIETLKPAEIRRFVDWIWPNDPAVEADVWQQIATGLEKRWAAEDDPATRHQLAQPLVQILSSRLDAQQYLAFLRRQLEEAEEAYRVSYANQLFGALLAQPWSAQYEDEALGLIDRLSDAEDPAERLLAQVRALYQFTDRMLQARYQAEMDKVENQEDLTRIELREAQQEKSRIAHEGLADRLRQARQERDDALKRWINIERLYIETLVGRDLDHVQQECWEMLGPKPPAPPAADEEVGLQQSLDAALRHRHLITMAYLAARADAEPELVTRLLAYVDAAIAQAPPEDVAWKLFRYQLLVAMDRPKEIEKDLRQWLREDDPLNYWRVSLGYLLAEQGLERIPEAITLFEAVEAEDELGPTEYRTLADWYMVVDRRQDYEEALIAVYKTMDEYSLDRWIRDQLRPWQQRDAQPPAGLDENVLRVFTALFAKSGSPQNYLSRLREFYAATRDFRLLTGLAEAVIGHTTGRVYPFLGGMGRVFSEIREEATVDSILQRIEEVRAKAETTVDRRALDLLEAIVERRAAEVQNQPGPHVEKSLAALRRAFQPEWSPGEPRLMAEFLAGLGGISRPRLAAEVIGQLEILHDGAPRGTIDRLVIAHCRARSLWANSRQEQALDVLEDELTDYQAAQDGVLPREANGPLGDYISYLSSRAQFARGEEFLLEQLTHPVNRQQEYWLKDQLYALYERALRRRGGRVSLGADLELYRALEQQIQDELDDPDFDYRRQLVSRLSQVYRIAKDREFEGHADDLRAFAFKRIPQVLADQTSQYQQIVGQVAGTIHDVIGPVTGLEFLVERIENEPPWLRYNNDDGWRSFAGELARWRYEAAQRDAPASEERLRAAAIREQAIAAGRVPSEQSNEDKQLDSGLEERLLAIVLTELRRDLESRQSRNRVIYWRHYSYFWEEKLPDFARVAEEVYQQQKDSPAAVKHIAEYIFRQGHPTSAPQYYDRAIEILFIALRQKILDESGQSTLVSYLRDRGRWGETIGVLEPLVELRPGNLSYRGWLMEAYFRTNRPAELLALLEQTDEYFHQQDRWTESAMASLAQYCLTCELYQQCVAYYEELIPRYQRARADRGIGSSPLPSYYSNMARAYAGLGNTPKAVDAACGAVVSWGPSHNNRAQALRALEDVLRDAPDLDAYVAQLDREVDESGGLDKPIVRKALGKVYLDKHQYAKAITQLQLACQGQPNDTETHQKLIECYDRQRDKRGAIRQLLASLKLSPRDIDLYQDLGRRFNELEQPDDMERAYTSIVEMLPTESESHTALAEIRQQQNRWDEAIQHWRRVAEIRALEPTGLLRLAQAQIHEQQWDAASETLRQVESKEWPSRFGNVYDQARNLERQMQRQRQR